MNSGYTVLASLPLFKVVDMSKIVSNNEKIDKL